MNRKLFLALLLIIFTLCASGCSLMPKSATQRTGPDCEKQLGEMTAANTDLRQSLAKTNTALQESEKTVADKQAEVTKLQEEKAALSDQVKRLQEQLDKAKPAVASAAAAAPTQPTGVVEKKEAQATNAAVASKDLRIKILAGTTQMAKARVLAMRLKAAGYKIEKFDRSRAFDQSIVYYGADQEKEAETIARYLGKNVETRKISWQSIFNVIVAVGKKP